MVLQALLKVIDLFEASVAYGFEWILHLLFPGSAAPTPSNRITATDCTTTPTAETNQDRSHVVKIKDSSRPSSKDDIRTEKDLLQTPKTKHAHHCFHQQDAETSTTDGQKHEGCGSVKMKEATDSSRLKSIRMEEELMQSFRRTQATEGALQLEIERLMRSRQYLPDDKKFSTSEEELIDRLLGWSNFEILVEKMIPKTSRGDRDEARFTLVVMLLRMPEFLLAHLGGSAHRQRQVFESCEDTIDMLPVKNPATGFPSNQEVLERFELAKNAFIGRIPFSTASANIFEPAKSPFGPNSSTVSYEECRTVNLMDLFHRRKGGAAIIPRTKMHLQLVTSAFASPTSVVSVIVRDDSDQYISLQIFNMKDVSSVSEIFPAGSRFYLKNPFLKIGSDGHWMLRVDQPFDFQSMELPPLRGSILIVGDGDFSYSAALATVNRERGSAKIVVTSLDSKEKVIKTYTLASCNLDLLEAAPNVQVHHGVDARSIDSDNRLGGSLFDSIVWNFPYPVHKGGKFQLGRDLIESFLVSATKKVSQEGRIYVTLARRQGGTSHEITAHKEHWDIERLASTCDLDLVDVLPFAAMDFVSYEPKRAYNDSTFPTQKAQAHVFQRHSDGQPKRDLLSRLVALQLELKHGWIPKCHEHTKIERSIELLEQDKDRSPIAKELLSAAKLWKSVLDNVPTKAFITSMEESVRITVCEAICEDMSDILRIHDAELLLVISERVWSVVTFCSQTVLSARASKKASFGALLCMLYTCRIAWNDADKAIQVAETNRSHFPEESLFFEYRANLNCSRLPDNEGAPNFNMLQENIIDDCVATMDLIGHEKTSNRVYQNALYMLAFAHRMSMKTARNALPLYKKYVEIVEPTDRQLPAACYHIAFHSLTLDSMNQGPSQPIMSMARQYNTRGLQAEKVRLQFFGPVEDISKRMLSMLLMVKDDFGKDRRNVDSHSKKGNDPHLRYSVTKTGKSHGKQSQASKKLRQQQEDTESLTAKQERIPARIRSLIVEWGDIDRAQFPARYKQLYRESLPHNGKQLTQWLKMKATETGLFSVVYRDKNTMWLTLPEGSKR